MTASPSRARLIACTIVAMVLLSLSAHAQQPNPRLTVPNNPKNPSEATMAG